MLGAVATAAAAIAEIRLEGSIEGPVDLGDDAEQRLIEERHRRSDFVQRTRPVAPQVARPPQDRDLLAQSSAGLGVLVGGQARVVEAFHEHRASPERDEEGPPAGLCRMGRQDRDDGQPLDELAELPTRGHGPREGADGPCDRSIDRPVSSRPRPTPERSNAMPFAGEVRELEIEAEGPDQGLGSIEAGLRSVDRSERLLELGCCSIAIGRVVGPASHDHPSSDTLDEVQGLGAGLLGDDLTEQGAQKLDLAGEGIVGPTRPDPPRLGPDRRVRLPGGRPAGAAAPGLGHANP